MGTVVCVGGGRLGSQAALEARARGDRALVIDPDDRCPARGLSDRSTADPDTVLEAGEGEVLFMQGDGVAAVLDILRRWVPDQVVPAARGHLAAYLAVGRAKELGHELVPSPEGITAVAGALPPDVVQLVDHQHGVAFTSYMAQGGTCMTGCPRPPACPVTGRAMPKRMHQLIGEALTASVDRSFVLVTRGEEVGGLAGEDLLGMLRAVGVMERGMTCGIATSCTCHGIVNALTVR